MQEKHQEEKLKYAQQLAQHPKSQTESIQLERQNIPLSENAQIIKSKIKISSHQFYGLPMNEQIINSIENQVDPFSYYFPIYFQTTIYGKQQLQQIKTFLKRKIHTYVKFLYKNFKAYSYFKFVEKRKKKEPLSISFKQFSSLNISLNIFSMMQAIQTNFIRSRSEKEQQQLKYWLLKLVEEALTINISDIMKFYPQGKIKENHQQYAKQMKKHLLKIDRRQNEQYDFLILNNIEYNKGAEKLILQIMDKISQISIKDYKLNDITDTQSLQNEIIKFNSLILEHSKQIKIEKSLIHKIQQNMNEKLDEKQERHYQEEPLRKIRNSLNIKCQKKSDFINIMSKNKIQSSSYLRILMKFIQNLMQLIEDPTDLTKLRKYPYKNHKNQRIQPNQTLNDNLYRNILKINSLIIENQGRNINQVENERIKKLMKIKLQLFQKQKEIIFSNFGEPKEMCFREWTISSKIYPHILEATFDFLQQLIQLIIDAGKVTNQDGRELNIHLVTFNLGDLFRAKKSVSLEEFKNCMNAIHILQDPLLLDSDSVKNVFRIVRYKDKTEQQAGGILLNYIYRNSVQCQLQINTNKLGFSQLFQVNHMLYELKRGQFGAISQILTLINTSYLQSNHPAQIVKLKGKHFNKSQNQQEKHIDRLISLAYENLQDKLIEDEKNKLYRNWTNIFIKSNQNGGFKKKEMMNLEKRLQKKNNYNRLQSLINEDFKLLTKIKQANQCKFVKNMVIKKRDTDKSLINITLADLRVFPCIQRIVLNGFRQTNEKNNCSINNIGFLNIYTLSNIKELNLSQNNISSFDSFFRYQIIYDNLQILSLSKNQFKENHSFAIGWFPKLKSLDLTGNKIKCLSISVSFTVPKANIIQQRELDGSIFLLHTLLQEQWIQLVSITKISIVENNKSLTILNDYCNKSEQIRQKSNQLSVGKQNFQQSKNAQKQQQTLKRQFYFQKKQIMHKLQPNQSVKVYESKLVKQKQQQRNIQNNLIIRLSKSTKKDKKQAYGENLLSQKQKSNKKFQSKAGVFFQSISGVILKKDKNTTYQQANAIKIYHNIVLAPAHSIIESQQHQKWLNPIKHKNQKQKIKNRTLVRLQDKQYTCKNFWIPKAYLNKDHGEQYMDICLLYLDVPSLKQEEQEQQENVVLHLVYKQQNHQKNIVCTLSAYVFGYLENFQTYGHCIVDAKINNLNNNIQIQNLNLKKGNSGSLITNIQRTGKNDQKYYVLGLYNHQLNNTTGFAQKINQELKSVYQYMVEKDNIQNNQSPKQKKKIIFESYQEFMKRKEKYQALQDVIKQEGKQLIFLRKFLKMFVKILENYFFIDKTSLDIKKEFFLKVHLYNISEQISGDSYEADLRGIKLKTVFNIIDGHLEFVQSFKSLFCVDLLDLQKRTSEILTTILKVVQSHFQNQSVEQITKFIIHFIQEKLQMASLSKPIALLKVLQLIAWTIDYKDQKEIIPYLRQLDQDNFFLPSYFSIINILINLNSCRRLRYYSQIIRCSKDAPQFAHVSDNGSNIGNKESQSISYQRFVQTEQKLIMKRERKYFSALEKVRNILQKRNLPLLQNQQNLRWNKANSQKQQLIENQINKIFMLQTLKDFYQQKQINQLLSQFNRINVQQLEKLIVQILQKNINKLFENDFEINFMKLNKQFKPQYLQKLKIEFQTICFYFKSLFQDSKQSSNCLNVENDFKSYILQSSTNNLPFSSSEQKKNQQQQRIDNNIQKKLLSQQGKFLNSQTQYYKFKEISSDKNQNLYENHIGLIYIYDDVKSNIAQWRNSKFAFGTGVLIGKRLVSTSAHVLTHLISGSFPLGKIKFLLTKQSESSQELAYEWANIVEVRLTKSKDIALLILDRELIKQPKIRLVTHNKISSQSNLKGRNYFCQIVGYNINTQQYNWRLRKSEGYIQIDMSLADFKYTLSTDKGQSGGAILFFPTGNYNQPYMLGIHTEGISETSNFLGINNGLYINEIFNKGRKFQRNLFCDGNNSIAIYAAEGFQSNQKIQQSSWIHQNSYIFSNQMYEICKWQLICQIHKTIFTKQYQQNKIYGYVYNRLLDYVWDHFQIAEISPQNFFCYDEKSNLPFFNIKINNYYQDFSQQFLNKPISKQQIVKVKVMFEKATNLYNKQIYAAKIISRHLSFVKELNEINQQKLQKKFLQFRQFVKSQLNLLINRKLMKQQQFNSFKDKIQLSLGIKLNIQTLEQLARSFQPNQHQVKSLNQLQTSLIYQDYQQLQQQFFNDEDSFKNYLTNFNGSSKDKDQLVKFGIRYTMVKLACSITQKFHSLYLRSNIKNIIDKQGLFQYTKTQKLQLDEKIYNFIPKQSNYLVPISSKDLYIQDIKHRASALFHVEQISFLQPKWRQIIIKKIMSFNKIKQYWKKKLLQNSYNALTQKQLKQQLRTLQQIISNIFKNYHYSVKGYYHFANLGRCCLEELYTLKEIAEKYSLYLEDESDILEDL